MLVRALRQPVRQAQMHRLGFSTHTAWRQASPLNSHLPSSSYQVVVIGGGSGGLAVSATLASRLGKGNVAVVEPSDTHYYQPLWTFVGGGLKDFDQSCLPMRDVIPDKADWLQTRVAQVLPESNQVLLASGQTVSYQYLVVAAGIQTNWQKIKGLDESLLGTHGIASNYSATGVSHTYPLLQQVAQQAATATSSSASPRQLLFTMPSTPIKCAGAPQKIMYLADEILCREGANRNAYRIDYFTGIGKIFAIQKYADKLLAICRDRGLNLHYHYDLTEIRPFQRQAVFTRNATAPATTNGPLPSPIPTETLPTRAQVQSEGNDHQITVDYDFIHVTPPMSAPDFLRKTPALVNAGGWVDVDAKTLQHVRFPNVFSLGDCSSLPTSKTAAAAAAESWVVKENLLHLIRHHDSTSALPAQYDGYTSCPLVTGKNKLVLAEFNGYEGTPLETLPFNQAQESNSAYQLTAHVIPQIYWQGMVRGMWHGPSTIRSAFKPVAAMTKSSD
ncbi:hypothetical protein H4R34_002696 [Dimargaris verticillata]|uniref:FAD/NAD(P)-binding domain-containing protein n=1 Tax=Dimargaris verticillata TaxID=2761393 RepID=A0A9W8B3M8_9FUNG|nr:hypothetical protein H4R34_002696 [Dimargaris verticillata]